MTIFQWQEINKLYGNVFTRICYSTPPLYSGMHSLFHFVSHTHKILEAVQDSFVKIYAYRFIIGTSIQIGVCIGEVG